MVEPSTSDVKAESESNIDGVPQIQTSPNRPRYDRGLSSYAYSGTVPPTPGTLSRNSSYTNLSTYNDADDIDSIPPLDRLTIFDFLENLSLPQRIEKIQNSLSAQTEKVRRQQQKFSKTGKVAKEKVVDEWRKRVPSREEQLDRYRKRMRESVDAFNKRWTTANAVTTREKASFLAGVLNIFISGYLIGAFPEYFHYWYSIQLAYFYPVRFYLYHKKGYHYFLADLCYFVNLLLLLSIWAFPGSKRLFISTFCLAFGNNAVAIAMWRNSLVFHSLDKITSLFIHIMPCVTIHCMVHLIPDDVRERRFPAVHSIKTSSPESPDHYSLPAMIVWATVPYAVWQLSYHFLITVRRREKIAAGRPTSFTWLRRSYAPTYLGKLVLSLPEALQEPAFMFIQYTYALLTMVPAPLWFWYRWASAGFLMTVFTWSVYNGAVYYIDIFGTRFQKELEKLKQDLAKWQMSPEIGAKTPLQTPRAAPFDGQAEHDGAAGLQDLSLGEPAAVHEGKGQAEGAGVSVGSTGVGQSEASSTGVEQMKHDGLQGLQSRR